MHWRQMSVWVKLVAFVTLWSVFCNGNSIVRQFSIVQDTGYATNCGNVPFNFSWTPKVLSAKYALDVAFNYTLPYPLDGGSYNLTLTEYGESEPFLTYANPFTCDDVKQLIKICPIPKGLPLRLTQHISKTKYLLSLPGRYILRAELKNKEGHQMLCALLDLTINNNM
ncbi:hypothetical protein ElyMa_001734000 [Elysia marginata]|uniref:MD-2-related lipid-recognition domain-containing protein n=1 Tax=Elysia marginata TaxID=1093978 RepID=A0AAV4JVX0_9GAST|nr:hypothetical protein ElyMa_001734000 [Elysia marginata]